MTGMWSRMTGRGNNATQTIAADLKKVTHSGVLDIPKELLTPIIEASKSVEDRPEIMKHLRECLAEPAGKHWRRNYGGLVIVEALVKSGCPELMVETAEGRHFDLVQRLTFLEHFDFTDKRVQSMIRTKAEALRKEVVPLLQSATENACQGKQDGEESLKDTASTCSPGAISSSTRSTTKTSLGFGSDDTPPEIFKPESDASRRMVLNGIVSVGHNDDTTSESECEDKRKSRAPVEFREPQRTSARERNARSRQARSTDSSDSDGNSSSDVKCPPAHASAAQSVDLLDF